MSATPEVRQFKVLDLFSGIGGFSLGLERTGGFKTIAFCEIDNYCQRVLHKHWPEVYIHSDIRTLTAKHFDGWERPDVIAGGFPCQDISNAGKQAGLNGARSGLWSDYARLIGEIRPKYVLVENVAALLGRGMGRVVGDLAAIGYDAEWDVISAADMGAPHLRERVWIVAYPASQRCEETGKLRRNEPAERIPCGCEARVFADTREERTEGRFSKEIQGLTAFSWCKDVGRAEDLRDRPDIPPPLFRGSRDGIPNWVDRIGACGNSIVPQIATWIGQRIIEAESDGR